MRIGTLISGILCWIFTVIQLLYILPVTQSATAYMVNYTDTDLTFSEMKGAIALSTMEKATPIMIFFMLVYLSWIMFYFQTFSTRKGIIIIGAICSIIGTLAFMLTWLINQMYLDLYKISCGIFTLGMLMFGFGMISYQDRFKIGTFIGPLMALISICVFGIMGISFEYDLGNRSPLDLEEFINLHLIIQNVYSFLIGGFAVLFAFSKRYLYEKYDEEELTPEKSVFASYIAFKPSKDIKQEKRRKKQKQKTKIDFDF
ncbi:MAG: hypothetical protein K9W44_04550 [Candidatus Lokiarchaeota archaeon]|nr:hypothetical protein [Candidatus Harpocratesius repetitus]